MNKTYDVAILGGGVVGMSLALALARERLRVALLQQPPAPDARPDIRAYALNHSAHALLSELRAWPAGLATTPVRQMWVSEPEAELDAASLCQRAQLCFNAPSAEQPLAWIVDVPALEQALVQALQYQSGIETVSSAPSAALTVICEGKHSRSRAELGFHYQVHPYAHSAVAARLHCAVAHGGVARQWFLNGDVLALLPLDGASGQSVALVWSVPHERAQQLLALPVPDFAAALQQACASALGQMELVSERAAWPLQWSLAQRWVRPGLALAGDAAHAMHPLAGQGLNMGLGDVAELARVLAEREYWRSPGDLRLLRRYERARRAEFERMAGLTDGLYHLFNHTDTRVQTLRRWGLSTFDFLGPVKRWAMQQAMGGGVCPRATALRPPQPIAST